MNTSDKVLRVSNLTTKHEWHKKWPDEKRIEVATKWLALGNMRLVSELTGVDYHLCRIWKQQPWWADVVAEIKASRDLAVDSKLAKIVDKSLDMISDRLENGDIIFNRKTGEVERREVPLDTINKVAKTALEQQAVLANKQSTEVQTAATQTIQDQIKMLAMEFAKFNTRRTIDVPVKEIEDAVETREAKFSWEGGLQPIDTAGTTGLHEGSEQEELLEESWETDSQSESDSGTTFTIQPGQS